MSSEDGKNPGFLRRVWTRCVRTSDSPDAQVPPSTDEAEELVGTQGNPDSAGPAATQDPGAATEPSQPGDAVESSNAGAERDNQTAPITAAEQDQSAPDSGGINELREFELAGGAVLPAPDNLGHLSHVYRLVRPKLVKMLFDELTWPDSGAVRVYTTAWRGCALAWTQETGDPLDRLYVETAIHAGGKDVNQDAVGACTGVLQTGDKSEPFAVVAIADGVTSSLYSEFGALYAVGMALRSAVGFLEASQRAQGRSVLPMPEAGRLARCLCHGFPACRDRIRQLQKDIATALTEYTASDLAGRAREARGAGRQHLRLLGEEGREHLSTTLITICATSRWFTVAGFGNGIVWVEFSTGDLAASWQPDSDVGLECRLSTNYMPEDASYTWAAPFEASGIVAVGAGTDGIPRVGALRSAAGALGIDATAQSLLDRIVEDQFERCPKDKDKIDNAAMARIDVNAVD